MVAFEQGDRIAEATVEARSVVDIGRVFCRVLSREDEQGLEALKGFRKTEGRLGNRVRVRGTRARRAGMYAIQSDFDGASQMVELRHDVQANAEAHVQRH